MDLPFYIFMLSVFAMMISIVDVINESRLSKAAGYTLTTALMVACAAASALVLRV